MRRAELTFQQSEADLVGAMQAHAMIMATRPAKLALWGAFALMLGLAMVLSGAPIYSAIALIVLMAVAFAALLLASIYISAPANARRQLRQNPLLSRTVRMSWDESGLRAVSERGESLTHWKDFYAYHQADKVFMIYYSGVSFFTVPRALLASDDEADLAKHLITAGVGARRRLGSA